MEANTNMKANTYILHFSSKLLVSTSHAELIPYAPTAEIDFTTPSRKRWKMLQEIPDSCQEVVYKDPANTSNIVPSDKELEEFYKALSETGKPAILSIISGHCEGYTPVQVNSTPPSLSDLFREKHLPVLYTDLMDKCNQRFTEITVSAEQAHVIEENTRSQAQSEVWFQRSGHITVSKLKAAVHTNISQPSQSLYVALEADNSTQQQQVGVVNMNKNCL